MARQVVLVHALPAAATPAEQVATGTSVVTFVEQVVVVKLFVEVAPLPVQVADGALLLSVEQVVAVQLFATAAASGTQEPTPVGPVVIGAGQVVVV